MSRDLEPGVEYQEFVTISGDIYFIPAATYDDEVRKYRVSAATDWEYAMKCEEGLGTWRYSGRGA